MIAPTALPAKLLKAIILLLLPRVTVVNAIVGAVGKCAKATVKWFVSLVWSVSISFARVSAIPPEVNEILARLVPSAKSLSCETSAFPELIV